MWISKRYLEHLEEENRSLKNQVQALVNSLYSVQGAPPPFVADVPPEEVVHVSRKRTDRWLAELAAAEQVKAS